MTTERSDTTDADGIGSETDSGDARTESFVRVLVYALGVLAKFVSLVASIAAVTIRLVLAVVTNDDNQRRARRWFLLEGNRWIIIGALVVLIFVGSVTLGLSNVIGVRESSFVTTMFSTIIAGLFSFVPLVIAVNQLTISRLFGTPDRLRQRIDGVEEFRRSVESLATDTVVSPTDPAAFLAIVAETMRDRAEKLDETSDVADEEVRAELTQLVEAVTEQSEQIEAVVVGDPELFVALLPTIDDDYSGQATRIRRLLTVYGDDLSVESIELLEEMRETYLSVDVARQYFKVIYLQQELATLSRLLAYSGTTAFLTSTLVIMIYASGYPPAVSEFVLLVLVALSLGVAFAPLAILFAFVIRIATVVKRTSAPGAFTPKGERPAHAR
ncbi:hypothetical protein [Halorussus halophilus]|uniref:hypothetical protein n=1 Tax=Halorussus halophilus TaxID=2650975 RepID=UPI0013013B4C|nr:hypothetical protein [Halorussus halophilus]